MRIVFVFLLIVALSLSGCVTSSIVEKTGDFLLQPHLTNGSMAPYGIVLGGVYAIEKIPPLRKLSRKPNHFVLRKMEGDKFFQKDAELSFFLDNEFAMKNKMKI